MLLKSIISEDFKVWRKHSPLEFTAASKHAIFQANRKKPLSAPEVMLIFSPAPFFQKKTLQFVSSIYLWYNLRLGLILLRRTQEHSHLVCHKVLTDKQSQLCDCWDCPKNLSQSLFTCYIFIDLVNIIPHKVTVLNCLCFLSWGCTAPLLRGPGIPPSKPTQSEGAAAFI